jgi:hypothetical protein
MTKQNFIDLIDSWLSGSEPTTSHSIHPEIISYNIGRAFNQIVYETFRQDLSNIDLYRKRYTGVSVEADSETGVHYSTLPESILQLPVTGEGVIIYQTEGRKSLNFVPVKEDAIDVFDCLEVGKVDGTVGFVVTDGKVFYYGMADGITSVSMRLPIPFEKYADTDEVHIPSGKDVQIYTLVCQFLGQQPKANTINDNKK